MGCEENLEQWQALETNCFLVVSFVQKRDSSLIRDNGCVLLSSSSSVRPYRTVLYCTAILYGQMYCTVLYGKDGRTHRTFSDIIVIARVVSNVHKWSQIASNGLNWPQIELNGLKNIFCSSLQLEIIQFLGKMYCTVYGKSTVRYCTVLYGKFSKVRCTYCTAKLAYGRTLMLDNKKNWL